MCPCCSGKDDVNNLDNFFDEKYQFRHANDYLRTGLDSASKRLIDWVSQRLDGSQTMLEIGCGAGMIHHDLLRRNKIQTATGVDASSAGLRAAARNAEKLSLTEKVAYHHQDFAQNPDQHLSADLVLMHKVICCYPYLDLLLGNAAEKTAKYLAISFPVENFVTKFGIKTVSGLLTLFGSGYHPYLHGYDSIQQTATQAGLRLVHADRYFIWKVMVFAR